MIPPTCSDIDARRIQGAAEEWVTIQEGNAGFATNVRNLGFILSEQEVANLLASVRRRLSIFGPPKSNNERPWTP